MTGNVTIFVVDDDPAALHSVIALLDAHGFTCRGFASATDFLNEYDPSQSGCLVTDLAMPEVTGLELHFELNERGWLIPTIVISGYAEVSQAVQAMQQGAVTVLEKPYEQGEFLEAVRAALEIESRVRIRARQLAELNRSFSRLSEAENDVLDRLVSGKSNKAIAFELGVAVRTIEHRRQRIYHKLDVESVAQLVARVAEWDQLLSGIPDVKVMADVAVEIQDS